MSTQPVEPKISPHPSLVQIGSVENVIQQRLAEERARLEREAGLHKREVHHFKRPTERPFTKEQRAKFTQGEGFLPVNKEEAKMDYYVNNADLAAFTALLPDARFAPVIPGWEEIAQITSDAMQKIYLGTVTPEQGLKDAAAKADAVLKKK